MKKFSTNFEIFDLFKPRENAKTRLTVQSAKTRFQKFYSGSTGQRGGKAQYCFI